MADANDNTTNWPELAGALYDKLTERHAELTYEFDHVEIGVPSGTGEKSEQSTWTVSGSISIRGRNLD
ncbi:hypothetical protein ACFFLZ_08760 [Photobacterium aphoticum]|uniref:Uncharacterized protein n=1 Tax=Photobacterium aphoticum TaxID=754436 RepID=A0A090QXV1_9GAMM|nr:hypothetical protein [Photobacterium aphoticum]KLU98532.1 hypothetical protein ABT58_22320 [Photobacterium aphoticum]PSU54512.1 hypothetical protein C9I90_20300 [Photobacterium aphoticum]GAL07088.1 hypothetical protein JCM19237_3093 [Photobacterium aphoticum]GHA66343.1 hypothetical protein GCM10007086_44890 [Photobacterium aphoticum]